MIIPKDFNWKSYLELNPSLKVVVNNEMKSKYHYFHYGRKLGLKYKKNDIVMSTEKLLLESESLIIEEDLILLKETLKDYESVKKKFEVIFGFLKDSEIKLEELLALQSKFPYLHCFQFEKNSTDNLQVLIRLCLFEKIIIYPNKQILTKIPSSDFNIDLKSFTSLKKINLGVLTASWKRKALTLRYCTHWDYLIDYFSNHVTINSVVVDSEKINKESIQKSKSVYLNFNNEPLSNKFNYGMNYFKNKPIDFVMIMGSDNFIDETLMFEFLKIMRNGFDLIGVLNSFIYDVRSGTLYNYLGYPKKSHRHKETLGAGRILSKKLLNSLNFHPWKPGLSKGLDGSMWEKLSFLKFKEYKLDIKKINGIMLGVKTDVFITDLNKIENKLKVDKKLVFKIKSLKGICF